MKKENLLWNATKIGLLGGAIAIFICLVGMAEIFSKRDVVETVITLGQFVLLATSVVAGFTASRQAINLLGPNQPLSALTAGLIAGLFTGLVLTLFVVAGDKVNIRAVFLNASPTLYSLLTFGKGVSNSWVLAVGGAMSGLLGAGYLLLPELFRRTINRALLVTVFMALFSNLFRVVFINQGMEQIAKFIFGQTGLTAGPHLLFWGYSNLMVLELQRQANSIRRGQASEKRPTFLTRGNHRSDRYNCPWFTSSLRTFYCPSDRYCSTIHPDGSRSQHHPWFCRIT
jgi:hypothetical protein